MTPGLAEGSRRSVRGKKFCSGMETFKAHYKANRLQRDIPDIKAGLTHRPPVSHTHPPHSDSPLLPLARSLSRSLYLFLSLSPANPNQWSVCETRVSSSEVLLCDGSGVRRRWGGAPSVNIRRCRSKFAMARLILPHGVCQEGRASFSLWVQVQEQMKAYCLSQRNEMMQ